MKTIFTAVQAFINDEDGATAIEYGLIAALIGIGVGVAATALSTEISALFGEIGSKLKTAL